MSFPVLKNELDDSIIHPYSLMLHNGESQLIFTDKNDSSQIFNFDLEAGKIVEQYQADKSIDTSKIRHLTNKIKNGQSSTESTFVGVNEKAIFTLDPRINKKDKAAQSKIYKTNPEFNQVATTFNGGLAIGSLNGEIRLYKEVGQNAKTLLPGLGDPIRGIDMSIDGNWVIATTQTYLLLIPTLCGNGKTGFEHRMGQEKPNPKKLQIHVKDLAKYRINSIDFTTARFNNFNQSSGEHTSIVASTGKYLITWNFKQLKMNKLRSYKISEIPGGEKVVDSQFMFNNDEKITVAGTKHMGMLRGSKKSYIQY